MRRTTGCGQSTSHRCAACPPRPASSQECAKRGLNEEEQGDPTIKRSRVDSDGLNSITVYQPNVVISELPKKMKKGPRPYNQFLAAAAPTQEASRGAVTENVLDPYLRLHDYPCARKGSVIKVGSDYSVWGMS